MTTRHYHRRGFSTTGLSNFSLTEIPTSNLLSLPREIRDDIVAHLLRAGDLAILRTSRQLYQESRERLYCEGVFRFKMGFPDSYSGTLLPDEWIKFHDLHLHIFVGRADKEDMPIAARMQLDGLRLDPEVIYPKRECRIVFDFGTVDLEPKRHLNTCKMSMVLPMLEPLVIFTKVVLMFVPGQSKIWESTSEGKWDIVKMYLERRLGPGRLICGTDEEEERMIFYPLKWSNSLNLRRTFLGKIGIW